LYGAAFGARHANAHETEAKLFNDGLGNRGNARRCPGLNDEPWFVGGAISRISLQRFA
jgi:hypothetical protein